MRNGVTKPCCVVLEQMTPQKQLALSAELRNVINERNILTSRTKRKVLNDLEELNRSDEKKNEFKSEALRELLDSEVTYLKQIEIINNFFMKPVQRRNLLSKSDFATIFGNIANIYNVNGELLNELKKDVTDVAKAFHKMAPYFKLYSAYAYDFKISLNILQRAQKEKWEFMKFVEQQESRPEVQNKLSALLIAPIQRIPRYRMLLKQILDYTHPSDPDHRILTSTIKNIENVIKHIDNQVEEQEKTQQLIDLQKSLTNQHPSLIKPGRKIIKQGVLNKMPAKGGKSSKKYFVLMNDILVYCDIKNSNTKLPNSLKCLGILPLNKCKVTLHLNKGCFNVLCEGEDLILYHERLHETKEWVSAINDEIKSNLDNRLTLRKESSTRRPVKRKHLNEYKEEGVSPGKPRKKRVYKEEDNEDDHLSTVSNHSDMENFKLCKRPSIHTTDKTKDVLYPLRASHSHPHTSKPEENKNNNMTMANTDLFVFGSNTNTRNGFSFSMGSFFKGIGNSVKNILGFKKT